MSGCLLRILWGVLALLLVIFWVGGFLSPSTSLLVLAVVISCAIVVSLRAWWAAAVERMDGPKPTLNLANILTLSTILGLALWVALPIYNELDPVLVPEDVGEAQRLKLSREITVQLRFDSQFKVTDRDTSNKDVILFTATGTRLIKGPVIMVYDKQDRIAYFRSQQEPTRRLVTRALRYGRRDLILCQDLLQLLENKDLPDLELQILELLHHTYPPKPQPEREEALRRALSAVRSG